MKKNEKLKAHKRNARKEPKSYYSLFSELFRYHNNIMLLIYPKILSENINVNTSRNSSKCWKRLCLGTGTRGMRGPGGKLLFFMNCGAMAKPLADTPHII